MRKYIAIILMILWIGLMLVLSFQNGQETASTSYDFTKNVLLFFTEVEPDWKTIMLWDGRFRFLAHFILLFCYGAISMDAAYQWARKRGVAFVVSLGTGLFFAVISEVGKLVIEGRHCDFLEMGLNVAGAVCGTLVVWGVYQIACRWNRL